MSIVEDIREELFKLRDEKYREFQSGLIPTIKPEDMIGVRTPKLREYARLLAKRDDCRVFLNSLPHKYFEENQLHAFIISGIMDYNKCIKEVCIFLPYIDNWASCDQLSPVIFKRNKEKLIEKIKLWLMSKDTYTVRFGIKMLMDHFLDDDFSEIYLEQVAEIKTGEYYISMMQAWYFATALAKRYDLAVKILEKKKMDKRTHNKAIQKAIESLRVPKERKEYLKTLRIK